MIPSNIAQRVSRQIKKGKVKPIPSWLFEIRNDIFWALVVASICIGGVVASLWIFLIRLEELDLYHLAFINPDAFILLIVLPFIWLILLFILSGITVFNLKHTKQGYRFGILQVLTISILGSLLLGTALHITRWNDSFDVFMKQNIGPYRELRDRRMNMWTNPEEGMLSGMLEAIGNKTLYIRDFDEILWEIDIAGVPLPPSGLMHPGMPLRIIGYPIDNNIFIAESIRPWKPVDLR